ncbi:MarR family transcriptional regulator [Mucilaginibacter pallidiroseus]|uniref:MarR family transcriptional regulator n=1 Tax=Mucilaginibacter pallidiroseus TaxID=2599295 RepID=A0A563UI41_9SPHI|nr:MarR family transcriptional regulator [Mucilaginibacter pallidiroseus]TWR30963.1 MarR family transcriptional regulator [Mucilaginibacter pallidiroseus]
MATNLLKLDRQLCFPLYALSRQITGLYRPLLEAIGLTYPQYLVMMLLWEHNSMTVKAIGQELLLDSGTLTPLLKRLEKQGLLSRRRDELDERSVIITLTTAGNELRKKAEKVPAALIEKLPLAEDESCLLINQLHTILKNLQ